MKNIQSKPIKHSHHLIVSKKKTLETIYLKKEAGKAELSIILEKEAKATIIEEWDEENNGENNYKPDVRCGPYSQLTCIVLQKAGSEARITESRFFITEENAKVSFAYFCFGSKELNSLVEQKAIGHSADLQMTIAAQAQRNQKISFQASQVFNEKSSRGHMEMKGVAQDQAELKFKGLIKITQKGSQTDASLTQNILDLSPQTKADASPALEIDTNDVKASHSAAVHNVNDEEILYLIARGITREEAKKMLVSGFLRTTLEAVKGYPELHDKIEMEMRG